MENNKLKEAMEKFNLNPPMSGLVTELMTKKAEPEVYNEWKRAFDRFNSDNNLHKGMGCRKCYSEVYEYLRKKGLLENPSNFASFEMPRPTYFPNEDFYPKIEDIKDWTTPKKLTLWQKIKKLWN